MKCLCLLAFVMVTQGFVLENSVRVKRSSVLLKPSILSLTAIDPLGFKLAWRPVTSNDPKDPVMGYKSGFDCTIQVKVWELPEVVTYKYKVINGVKTLVEDRVPPKMSSTKLPEGKPQEFVTDKTTLVYNNAKLGVLYEARVQAFTKEQDGPESEPMRIKLHNDDRDKEVYKTV